MKWAAKAVNLIVYNMIFVYCCAYDKVGIYKSSDFPPWGSKFAFANPTNTKTPELGLNEVPDDG